MIRIYEDDSQALLRYQAELALKKQNSSVEACIPSKFNTKKNPEERKNQKKDFSQVLEHEIQKVKRFNVEK